MLHDRRNEKHDAKMPIYGSYAEDSAIVKTSLRRSPIDAQIAYRLISDELMDEGNARQNFATFCQTYMEPEAVQLMSETLEKNAIDKSEYPQTAKLENYCVNVLADLWSVQKDDDFIGTSTVGSSEACMLAGMAMKFRWRTMAKENGLDINAQKPNLIISSGFQVCWEKFGVYWDVDLIEVPVDSKHMSINTDILMDYVNEYTIGIVGILGITYTGKFDDIEKINHLVDDYNKKSKWHELVIHVDGASGAMFTPFVNPELPWDFRLKHVVSINTSGHKYGLVYPGIGWVLWKDKKYLPEELVFDVSYLGGHMPTMAINFSRSASQVIAQYYNFLRLGFDGYRGIHERTKKVALFLSKALEETGLFEIYNDGANLPIVCYTLKADTDKEWTLYDLTDRLQMKGWQVPTYPLPKDMEDVLIQRYVCRADLGFNVAEEFVADLNEAVEELDKARILAPKAETTDGKKETRGFTH
ncbi:glutamate decarboxylase [Listeria booriae]|uniref:Glutamate decarboxylase n=1 Tax=Listeria booriae TaxID=1552123 RepID=A0A099WI95_9LIST|nr:glutamate decarboxylase [Listeria booriae]KGL45419.1 glutamate decarboxylase [Listeria booriae]MBC1210334.1 glutamate decarboxylase [Listeria booriae]MBC1225605.1 glutamate decarboxylase [Listeria booriae]MBC1232275.1 glutamate decarboxylase [Listeria booriae]MBC1246738.1 glutamate decarboxylase [Listeria booriae]